MIGAQQRVRTLGLREDSGDRLVCQHGTSNVWDTKLEQNCRGVVMALAATVGRRGNGAFRDSDSTDEFGWSFRVEHLDQVDPVEEVESLNEAGGAVGEDGAAT